MWRQGDVLIAKIETLPKDLERRSELVLAEGEITGHKHQILEETSSELWADSNGILYLNVLADEATIVHDEHGPITLERGIYRVWRQREYAPDSFRIIRD